MGSTTGVQPRQNYAAAANNAARVQLFLDLLNSVSAGGKNGFLDEMTPSALDALKVEAAALKASVGAEIPIVTTYRTRNIRAYGSSTFGNTGAELLTTLRGISVPAGYLNRHWDEVIRDTVPTQTAKTVSVISIPPLVGNNNTTNYEIKQKILVDIGTNAINSNTIVVIGGVNAWTMSATIPPERGHQDTSFDSVDYIRIAQEACNAVSGCRTMSVHTFPIFGTNDQFKWGQWTRLQDYYKDNGGPYRGVANFFEAMLRTPYDNGIQDDLNAAKAQFRPAIGAAADTAHSPPETYDKAGKYLSLLVCALEDGLPFIPSFDYGARLTAPGFVEDIYYSGVIRDGCTFSTDNAAFEVVPTVNPAYPATSPWPKLLKLNLVGALPAIAPLFLNITVSEPGYVSQTYRVTVSIIRRPANDHTPRGVLIRHGSIQHKGYNDIPSQVLFTSNPRKLSMVMILQLLNQDGLQNNFREQSAGTDAVSDPAGPQGTVPLMRIDRNGNVSALELRRNGGNGLTLSIVDPTGSTNTLNYAGGTSLQVSQGRCAIFVSLDSDNVPGCGLWRSAAPNNHAGANYGLFTAALNPLLGTGTFGLSRSDDGTGSEFRMFQDQTYMRCATAYLTHYRTWMVDDYVDFSVQANRDAFFNEATQMPVALPGDGSTFLGITPKIDIRCDAAEYWYGNRINRDWTNVPNGAKHVKNHGSLEGFMACAYRPFEFATVGG